MINLKKKFILFKRNFSFLEKQIDLDEIYYFIERKRKKFILDFTSILNLFIL
jgi:hypothetical protein